MCQKPIKTAVIGVGTHGWHHARIYAAMENVELTAVADLNGQRAREVAGRCHAGAETDYRKLLGKVDAVTIAVPTVEHHARTDTTCSLI